MRRRAFALGLACATLGGRAFAAGASRQSMPTLPPPPPGDRLLQLQPAAPVAPGETHSALAVSNRAFGAPHRFSGRMRTVKQLRAAQPNAWEVGWLFWNYVDNNHLHYFLLKPNGWEIGKRDPRYFVAGVNDGQKIIATGESAKLAIGEWYEFDVRVAGASAEIFVNGRFVCRFQDPDPVPLTAGRVGLYCEDALCQWNDIRAPFEDGFEMEPLQPFADGSQLTHWKVAFLGYGSGGIVAAGGDALLP